MTKRYRSLLARVIMLGASSAAMLGCGSGGSSARSSDAAVVPCPPGQQRENERCVAVAGRAQSEANGGREARLAATPLNGRIAWPDLGTPGSLDGDGTRDAALVVAIENYAFLPPIAGARQNGRDWFTYLTRSRGIPAERVRLLVDAEATDFAIVSAAEEITKLAPAGGRVWLVFVGHGAPSRDGNDGLLVTATRNRRSRGSRTEACRNPNC